MKASDQLAINPDYKPFIHALRCVGAKKYLKHAGQEAAGLRPRGKRWLDVNYCCVECHREMFLLHNRNSASGLMQKVSHKALMAGHICCNIEIRFHKFANVNVMCNITNGVLKNKIWGRILTALVSLLSSKQTEMNCLNTEEKISLSNISNESWCQTTMPQIFSLVSPLLAITLPVFLEHLF